MMEKREYLENYIDKLTEILVQQATSKGFLDGKMLVIEELEELWREIAPEYMADAVPEIPDYPTVAVAWAGYLGMGLANIWDKNWEKYKTIDSLYNFFREPRGFDAMDEYICEKYMDMKLDSPEYKKIEDLMRSLSQTAVSQIRRENIEPQSIDAFHVYSNTVTVFFKLGVSIELKRLGYRYEKVVVDLPEGVS